MLQRFAQFLGPIFVREAVEIGRRKRFYFSRTVYGLTLLVVMAIVWEEYRWLRRGAPSTNAMAAFAAMLFDTVSVVQYAAVYLFVPMFLCGVVAGEREEHTLDLLLTTHLSDREIVLGKLGSRAAAMACLILCGLPVMSVVMLLGGIGPESLWRALAATLAAILFVGAHAVYFSVTTKSPLEALVRTYWWLGIWLVGVPVLGIAILEEFRWLRQWAGWWPLAALAQVNPIAQFVVGMNPYFLDGLTRLVGPWFYSATFALPAGWSAFLLWRAIRRLRQTPTPVLLWVRKAPLLRTLVKWWNRPTALARRRAGAERLWRGRALTNPLWLRARLAHIYDRSGHIGLLQAVSWAIAFTVLVLVAIFDNRTFRDEEFSMGCQGLVWIAVGALAGLIAGSSLIGDRRRGFLELVLVTPLPGQEIVDGTFMAVWEHVRRLFWLPWLLGTIFCLTGASLPGGTACSLITATLFCVLFVWHGIVCALAARTVPAALIATFLFPVATMGATGLLIGFFGRHSGPAFWIVGSIFVVATVVWDRSKRSPASIAALSIAVHLVLAGVATFWTYDGRSEEYPIGAMQPVFYVVALLDDRPEPWFGHGAPPWFAMLLCYWTAVVINIVLLRRWLIRNFDALADRAASARH